MQRFQSSGPLSDPTRDGTVPARQTQRRKARATSRYFPLLQGCRGLVKHPLAKGVFIGENVRRPGEGRGHTGPFEVDDHVPPGKQRRRNEDPLGAQPLRARESTARPAAVHPELYISGYRWPPATPKDQGSGLISGPVAPETARVAAQEYPFAPAGARIGASGIWYDQHPVGF